MLTSKQRWWAEAVLDVIFTIVVGWFLLGAMAGAIVSPHDENPGEFAKALPLLVQLAVTYGIWKWVWSFDWLQGSPPDNL